MEAVGSMAEQADLVVQPLEPAVREAMLDGGDDAFVVLAEGPAELHEGRQARTCRPGEPLAKSSPRPSWRAVVDVAEGLLEEVGTVEGTVGATEKRERLGLIVVEVLGRALRRTHRVFFTATRALFWPLSSRTWARRTSSTAAFASFTTWNGSKTMVAFGSRSRTLRMYAWHMSRETS
jgi:hypothetical protein